MRYKFLILLIIFIFLFAAGCKGDKNKEILRQEIVTGVRFMEVKPVLLDDYYEVSGTISSRTITTVSARVMGEVRAVYVREGEHVRQGEVILKIDDKDYRERYNQAKEGYEEMLRAYESAKQNLKLQELTYERYKRLLDERAISQQEFDQIETQKNLARLELERYESAIKRAKAVLEEAKIYLGYTEVVSPINGIVVEKKVEIGNMVSPGTPLFIIEDNRHYKIDVFVDERLSGKIRTGARVPVMVEAISKNLDGRVSKVVPYIDPMSRTFPVEIDLNSPDLKTGLYAKVRFPAGKKEGIAVPEKAIQKRGGIEGVYVVDDKGVISYRIVRTGALHDRGLVEIISGLNGGERVIVDNLERVVEGGIVSLEKDDISGGKK